MYFFGYYNEFEYNHDLVVIVVIVVVIIIRMNFTQFQFFKRQIRIWNVYSFQYIIAINFVLFNKTKIRSQQIVIFFTCSHTLRTQIISHIRDIFIYVITSHKRTYHITTNIYIFIFSIFYTYFK